MAQTPAEQPTPPCHSLPLNSWDHRDMAGRITLKTVNDELAKRGIQAVLTKAPDYYYFRTGEAADWIDRTVQVPTLNALTSDQWVEEFERLKKLNSEILGKAVRPPRKATASRTQK
jgi:hypothetical protein